MSEAEYSAGNLDNLPPHPDGDRFASIVFNLYMQDIITAPKEIGSPGDFLVT